MLRSPQDDRWDLSREETLPEVVLDQVEAPYGSLSSRDNLLIHGDCLLVCLALNRELEGRVSLIYADPPFNTGNPNLAYEDNLSHPQWLSIMAERLCVMKRLLRPGGIISFHIGVTEQPYLRVLMDEIFGRGNLISQISWQRGPDRTLLGQGSSLVNDCVEYILVYSNGTVRRDLGAPKKEEPLSWKTLRTYGRLLDFSAEKEQISEFADAAGSPVRVFRHKQYSLTPVGSGTLREAFFSSHSRMQALLPRMARLTNQQLESTFQQALLSRMSLGDTLYSAEYTQRRGKHRGPRTRYYINKQVVLFLKDVASIRDGKPSGIVRVADLNNFWTSGELPVTGIAREGGVFLKRGKKPESLLYRVITAFSREGETILDPFAGSGTTGAVAHKTGRRWIMIDDSDSAISRMTERMKAVVSGADTRGVTKLTGWAGGGGFRILRARRLRSPAS